MKDCDFVSQQQYKKDGTTNLEDMFHEAVDAGNIQILTEFLKQRSNFLFF